MAHANHIRLSSLVRDPFVASAFARIERDGGGALVLPKRPEPVLSGGAVAKLEVAS